MTPPAFRILAYATSGVIESIISYEQLTHINYAFLTPNADGTFSPINNGWELEQIVQAGHARNVKVMISVGSWGWDQQFETMAGAQADEFEYQGVMQIYNGIPTIQAKTRLAMQQAGGIMF